MFDWGAKEKRKFPWGPIYLLDGTCTNAFCVSSLASLFWLALDCNNFDRLVKLHSGGEEEEVGGGCELANTTDLLSRGWLAS